MYGSPVTSLPVTGTGSSALLAVASGHITIALVLASICALTTGLLMLQRPEEDFEEDD